MELTQQELIAALHYDPGTGLFTRKAPSGTAKRGSVAGCVRPDGYIYISVRGKQFLAHRLAWFYVHGYWPENHTDHIDRDRQNNRIANLRPATSSQNVLNSSKSKANSSGHKGVYWSSSRGKWIAQICLNRRPRNLGGFDALADAVAARKAAETKELGEAI